MDGFELKKSLFGYKKSSVYSYIATQNSEFKESLNNLENQNEELKKELKTANESINEYSDKNSALSEELDRVTKEYEKLVALNEEMSAKIDTLSDENKKYSIETESQKAELEILRRESQEYHKNQIDIANVILEAQGYADSLRKQADNEYSNKQAENNRKISVEKEG